MGKDICNQGIYRITNKINNKVYIGSSINLSRRKTDHFSTLKNNRHRNSHLQRAFNLYGKDNFYWEVVEYVQTCESTEETLITLEQKWMDKLQAYDDSYGYNICPVAGRANKGICTEETRRKLSLAGIGRIPWNKGISVPLEIKIKISNSLKGRIAVNKGKTISEETRKKISEASKGNTYSKGKVPWNKGVPLSEEQKLNLSEKNKGKTASEETKTKMSLIRKGVDKSEEHKINIGKANRKPVINITTGKIYNSVNEAQEDYGLLKSHISVVCKGKRKRACGCEWAYYKGDIDD